MRLTPGRENWHPVTSETPLETGKTIDVDSSHRAIAGDHAVSYVEEMASRGALLAERSSFSISFSGSTLVALHGGNRPSFAYLGEGRDAALIPS